MANNIPLYSTTTMLKAVEKKLPLNSFLRDVFFPVNREETLLTEDVVIDFKKSKRKMAPFVAPKVGGVTMDRDGYRTALYKAPRIAPQRVTTKEDITGRGFGENLISTKSPEQRAAETLGRDLGELSDYVDRRIEYMVKELIFKGEINVKGYVDAEGKNTVDDVIKFGEKQVVNASPKWDTETADIYGDLLKWKTEIVKKTGVNPSVAILSSEVGALFLKSKSIQELYNLRNITVGSVNPVIKANGATYIGSISALGLDLYTYDEWVINPETGEEEPMVPKGHIVLGGMNSGSIKYGLVTQMEKDAFMSYEGKKVPKRWSDEANDRMMLRLTSRPIPVPDDIDSWIIAKVI